MSSKKEKTTVMTDLVTQLNNASLKKSEIAYSKTKKVLLPVKQLFLQKIPVLESIQLSFYQKYIVLILQKGFVADSKEDLIYKLSNLLNISLNCVRSFIVFLANDNYLAFDKTNRTFALDEGIHVTINPELDNAMFAELSVKDADCNKVVMVRDTNDFRLEDDFIEEVFKRRTSDKIDAVSLSSNELSIIDASREAIKQLISRYYENTNFHLLKDFSFEAKADASLSFDYEFEAIIKYKYNQLTKVSNKSDVVVSDSNFISKDLLDKLTAGFNIDDDLPKFIRLKDSLYNEIAVVNEELGAAEIETENAEKQIEPIKESIDKTKKDLASFKKDTKKEISNLLSLAAKLEKEISDLTDSINVNEQLIAESDQDEELLKNLKKGVGDLEAEKKAKEKELADTKKKAEDLGVTLEEFEKETEKILEKEKTELKEARERVKTVTKKQEDLAAKVDSLISDNSKDLKGVISACLRNYPPSKNLFNRYVSEIVLGVDSAMSASEFEAYDEMAMSIDAIREKYRKVLQIIFDKLLGKNESSLGNYFGDKFNRIALEDFFKTRGLNADVLQRLIMFHELANAVGHIGENGEKKSDNLKRIEDFKKLPYLDRTRILKSLVDFFFEMHFTNAEANSFISRLKI